MRIRHTIQLATAFTTIAALGACSMHHARHDDDSYSTTSTTVEWDSGPLDREYQTERSRMESRHADEMAHARADETADRRTARQAAERQDLEDRYSRGKKQHMRKLPPSDHDNNGYNH